MAHWKVFLQSEITLFWRFFSMVFDWESESLERRANHITWLMIFASFDRVNGLVKSTIVCFLSDITIYFPETTVGANYVCTVTIEQTLYSFICCRIMCRSCQHGNVTVPARYLQNPRFLKIYYAYYSWQHNQSIIMFRLGFRHTLMWNTSLLKFPKTELRNDRG